MIELKTKDDIRILRQGGKRHASIMAKLAAMVKSGLVTSEIDAMAVKLIAEGGDEASVLNFQPYGADRPYPASVCVSVNDEIVHGIPTENPIKLKEGDIVSIDFGLTHEGLVTDMAVTVPVGKISKELEDLLDTTKLALMTGIKAAKGGNRTGDIGAAIERVGLGAGYGIVEELAGHGVGYGVHEEPFVPNYGEPGKGDVLKPGTVIAIEPMFNLGSRHIIMDDDGYTYRTKDGKPSAHFEHTVLITKGDAEILTLL
jgi:methionyl aminopeptidase